MTSGKMDDTERRENSIIALIGFMGAGKSAVGSLLSTELSLPFVDLDEVIEKAAGKSVAEIFAEEGEEGFRERESEALRDELREGGKVIACGGGVVLNDENIKLLRSRSRVFLLNISPERALERLSAGSGRPLLDTGDLEKRIRGLMDMRAERYREAAHTVFDADNASPREIAEEIAAEWLK
jgi:shikimate kinase